MSNQEVISTLNDLLQISRDGELGFNTCSQGVQSPNIRSQLQTEAQRCAQGATELEAQIRNLGGQPAQGGSVSGSVHRAWTNIKSTITGMNESAVLAECERGENAASQAYEQALQKSLPPNVKTLIERQYQGVQANQNRVRSMRNQQQQSG